MKHFRIAFLTSILLTFVIQTFAEQSITGIPRIHNYNKFDYHADAQNWMTTNAPNGLVYFANNRGLLEFDGSEWQTYNSLGVVTRAVLYHNNRIYASGFNIFGYYAPNENGNLTFHIISNSLKDKFKYGEVWRICERNGIIYFQANEGIFVYNGKTIKIIKALSRFDFMYFANGLIFVNDLEHGLFILENNKLKSIDPKGIIKTKQLSGVSSLDSKSVLISTSNNGIFIYDNKEIKPWNIEIASTLKRDIIYTEKKINGYHCFGTILNGLYVINNHGKVVLHVNQEKGLTSNAILSIGQDSENNIWLGLNNGISKLELSSPLSYIGTPFKVESVYASAYWNNKLYIGTNSGLFTIDWEKFLNPMKTQKDFHLIPGSEGQVWNLTPSGNTLLCGHNNGIYVISPNNSIQEVKGIRGGWLFIPTDSSKNRYFVGTYNGLSIIERTNGSWHLKNNIEGFNESSRFIERDSNGDFWVSHGYKGIYKLHPNSDYTKFISISFYGEDSGLPSNLDNSVWKVNDRIIVSTRQGLYQYNTAKNKFEKTLLINSNVSNYQRITALHQEKSGDIWVTQNYQLSVFRLLEDGKYKQIISPFYPITRHYNITFEHINNLPNRTTLIGLEDGIAIYDPTVQKQKSSSFKVLVKRIASGNKAYSFSFINPSDVEFKKSRTPLSIQASAPINNSGGTMYSFKLQGFDKEWSPWNGSNKKEYTNLSEGTYKVQIKAMNYAGEISPIVEKTFTILPPWYRSTYAYFFYILFFIYILYTLKKLYDKNIEQSRRHGAENQKIQFKAREEQLIKDSLQAENEVIRIKNESLQDNMKRKERELALSTMHIIQKNELINKMKTELRKLQTTTTDKTIKDKASDIIKKVSKDVDNRSEWKTFELHFELVHEDFIQRLKEKYPDLTARELRLCAYLKMNMASKEIANLMNISPRGVEISRYRIRKKMGLERNEGLTEVLMDI